MVDKKQVLEVAKYMIENNATIDQVCKKFNMSRRTAQIYTGQYLREIASIDESFIKLYKQIEIIKDNSQKKSSKGVDMESVIRDMISNYLTKEMAAKKHNISESSISKYLQSLDENDELKVAYKQSRERIRKIGNIVGGLNGQRQATNTDFEAREVAQTMVEQGLTLDEASAKFDRPRSTIYDIVRRIDDQDVQDELDVLFDSARRQKK